MYLTSSSSATVSGASFTSCSAVSETERPATTHYALRQLVRPSARIRTTSSFTTIDSDCCTCTQPFKLQFDPLTTIARPPPIINLFITPTYTSTLCASENAAPQSVPSRVTYPPTAANGSGVTATTMGSIIRTTTGPLCYAALRWDRIGLESDRIGWAPRCVTGMARLSMVGVPFHRARSSRIDRHDHQSVCTLPFGLAHTTTKHALRV